MRTCETCRWWMKYPKTADEAYGACRKYAPQPHTEMRGTNDWSRARWPTTYHDAWCGEHTPKETDDAR